jgi:hypothetical protein
MIIFVFLSLSPCDLIIYYFLLLLVKALWLNSLCVGWNSHWCPLCLAGCEFDPTQLYFLICEFICEILPLMSVFLTLKNVTFRALGIEFWHSLTFSSSKDCGRNAQNPESQCFECWLSGFYTLMFSIFTSHSVVIYEFQRVWFVAWVPNLMWNQIGILESSHLFSIRIYTKAGLIIL